MCDSTLDSVHSHVAVCALAHKFLHHDLSHKKSTEHNY